MNEATFAPPPKRSTFVNVVAWIFIVISGFVTIISLLQNVMITLFFPVNDMQQAMHSAKGTENIPPMTMFMIDHIRLFFAGVLVYASATFVSSIGLLLRKNWARLLFIALLALNIAWMLFSGIFFQFAFHSESQQMIQQMPRQGPAGADATFETMFTIIMIVSIVFSLAIAALLGWIVKRLVSAPIRAEFS